MDRDERLAGHEQRAGIGARAVLPERFHRQEAEHADDDERAFDEASGDVAECEGLVLPPQQREQHHRGGDVGDHGEDLEEGAERHAEAGTRTEDVERVVEDRAVGQDSGDRKDEGQHEQDADRERGLSLGVHRESFRCRGSNGVGHVGLLS